MSATWRAFASGWITAWKARNNLDDDLTNAADLLDAINELHQRPEPPMPQDQWPADAWFVPWCSTCSVLWPCPTARLLHPAPEEDK